MLSSLALLLIGLAGCQGLGLSVQQTFSPSASQAPSPRSLSSLRVLSADSLGLRLRGGGADGTGGKGAEELAPLFYQLLEEAGGKRGVSLKEGQRGKGLFALNDTPVRGMLLTVPLDACIPSERSVSEDEAEALLGRPISEIENPHSFTWDVRLAISLLEKTGKLQGREAKASEFWEKYAKLLPDPESLAQPLNYHPDMLKEFQHVRLVAGAVGQQERLRKLFPQLMPEEGAGQESYPSPLQWAFTMVRSRAYSKNLRPSASTQEPVDSFAFVPFFDMANHGEPNANFYFNETQQAFILEAIQPVKSGEEILICYMEEMPNRVSQALYGFIFEKGNFMDDIEIPAHVLASERAIQLGGLQLSGQLLQQALGLTDPNSCQQILLNDPALNAMLMSLPINPEPMPEGGVDGDAEKAKAETLIAYMQSELREMGTTIKQDEEYLGLKMQEALDQKTTVDERLVAAIKYRIARKKLLERGVGVLNGYIGVLQPAS